VFVLPSRLKLGHLILVFVLVCLAWTPVWAGTQAKGRLLVRGDHNYPPYEFQTEEGASGFNVEIMRAVAEVMGLDIEVRLGPWREVRSDLEAGRIDVLTGMFHSEDRDLKVDFCASHLVVSHAVFVRRDSEVERLDDLRGREIIVEAGDIMHDFASANGLSDRIIAVDDQAEALRLLASGRHDGALLGKLAGLYLAKKFGLTNIKTVGPPIFPQEYCLAVKEGDRKLLDTLNEGLSIIKATGKYDQIYRRWFGEFDRRFSLEEIKRIGTMVLAPLVILLSAALIWSLILKRRLSARTDELQRELAERKRMEEALAGSERRYRELFNNISDLIVSHDLDGRIINISPSVAETLGFGPEELIGRSIDEFIPPEHRPAFQEEYLVHLRDRGQTEGVFAVIGKTGELHLLEYRSVFVGQSDQGGNYVTTSAREVTERIRARRELRRMQRQLIQSQKMEAVGTLASGIAHDFNNLLQVISGYVQLFQFKNGLDPTGKEYLSAIETAVRRAADLVRRLLAFSRKTEGNFRPINLNEEINQTVKILERTIPKMIEIEIRLTPDLPPIIGDSNQLEQVILNLASNAKDAMPEGGKIIIETEQATLNHHYTREHFGVEPGDYVLLRFTDTGQGMDTKTAGRIFEPFFTTKPVGQGTGLGLSVIYGVVKAHKGHISFYSAPGRGTTFNVYFPVPLSAESTETPEKKIGEKIKGGIETILLADDERPILEMVEDLLQSQGYSVLAASTGEEALAIFLEQKDGIDLAILDLGMPGMGGQACLTELLKIKPGVKVIVASGYWADSNGQKALQAGARKFISKPYHLIDLLKTVREVLDDSTD